jgi:hypothetical protein
MNSAQKGYTTTEKELLSIVKTLKEFRNILLAHQIIVHTDHKNLIFKFFNTERVMRWRLVLEEFGPELRYIKGERNIVAEALSCLDMNEDDTIVNVAKAFGYDNADLPADGFPVKYRTLAKAQKKDRALLRKLLSHNDYREIPFRGGDKSHDLICKNEKIVVPEKLQRRPVNWYHEMLCHPGVTRTELTIRQHFNWKDLRTAVHDICHKCESCQKSKVSNQKCGKLPPKAAETNPWDTLCVDLVGPYKIPHAICGLRRSAGRSNPVSFPQGNQT